MTHQNFQLPPGTTLMVDQSRIVLTLQWRGPSGRHLVCLEQTMAGHGIVERDQSVIAAIARFWDAVEGEQSEEARRTTNAPADDPSFSVHLRP